MKLIEVSYKKPNWELVKLSLGEVNLIVGKNSVGKSRVLSSINWIWMVIQNLNADIFNTPYWNLHGSWVLTFETETNTSLVYEVKINFSKDNKRVLFEQITLDNSVVLSRANPEKARLKSFSSNEFITISPPEDKLILHVRRDREEFPFLEQIVQWAERSFGLQFGIIGPNPQFHPQKYDLLNSLDSFPILFNGLKQSAKTSLIDTLKQIGYNVEKISVKKEGPYFVIYVEENGIPKQVPHYKLSQGMYRALSILIYMEYLISHPEKPATIIIDDLCEGLDYDRATKLGKLVFDKCLNSNIQLIATSNDSFLMDVVDIKYWNVLQRDGSKVTSINIHTHPKLFEDFKFTGLSNFDFFSSDYIKQGS